MPSLQLLKLQFFIEFQVYSGPPTLVWTSATLPPATSTQVHNDKTTLYLCGIKQEYIYVPTSTCAHTACVCLEWQACNINMAESCSKNKSIRGMYKGIHKFKRGYQPKHNLVINEIGDLLADSHNIWSMWKNYLSIKHA
jgi:hypothetical protein